MLTVSDCFSKRCRRFHVVDLPSASGPRLGGRAPAEIVPVRPRPVTRYLLTADAWWRSETEFSVFLHGTYEEFLALRGKVQLGGLVEVVVHGLSRRGSDSAYASELSEHKIVVDSEEDDVEAVEDDSDDGDDDDEDECRVEPISTHKMDGCPYILRNVNLSTKLCELARSGMVQVIQLDFPANPGDGNVSGNWPFGDGLFHLFADPKDSKRDWAWFWEI